MGKCFSEEHKRKIGDANRGNSPWNKGKHLSEEHKRNIGKAHLGTHRSEESKKKMSDAQSGEKHHMFGKHLSEEHKRKIGDGNRGKIMAEEARKKVSDSLRGKYGELARNWKGGRVSLKHQIRESFEYKQWRDDIYTRDDFTCQECGKRGVEIHAHHYPNSFSQILEDNRIITHEQALVCEEFWNIDNGITMCKECHKKEHSKFLLTSS